MPSKTKSKSTWQCEHGCDLSTKSCQHLEAKLPSLSSGMFEYVSSNIARIIYTDRIEDFPEEPKDEYYSLLEMERVLDKFPLTYKHRQVLKERFFGNSTYREIARRLKIQSVSQVHTLYKEAIELIRGTLEVEHDQSSEKTRAGADTPS